MKGKKDKRHSGFNKTLDRLEDALPITIRQPKIDKIAIPDEI
jgi:hypothetical protein